MFMLHAHVRLSASATSQICQNTLVCDSPAKKTVAVAFT